MPEAISSLSSLWPPKKNDPIRSLTRAVLCIHAVHGGATVFRRLHGTTAVRERILGDYPRAVSVPEGNDPTNSVTLAPLE
jgi:hypothetical protein